MSKCKYGFDHVWQDVFGMRRCSVCGEIAGKTKDGDPNAGKAERDESMEQVDRAADPDWKEAAYRAITEIARRQDTLTSDDVWFALIDAGEPTPDEPRALGPLMRSAMTSKVIVPTGDYAESRRAVAHRNPKRVWRSLLRG